MFDSAHQDTIEVSTEEIQSLNVILNNNDCGDAFFQKVCDVLEEDNIPFRTVYGSLGEDVDSCTVITLDMQYSAGNDTLIFAPVDNARIGYSDSLVLAMQAAFYQNGFIHHRIASGQVGFRKDENGMVQKVVPTPSEEAITPDYNTSVVTISFGTNPVDPVKVAKAIENALMRQKHYLEYYDAGSDLIYKAKAGESTQVVANYFGTTVKDLCSANQLKHIETLEEIPVVNPEAFQMKVFDPDASFQMQATTNKTY